MNKPKKKLSAEPLVEICRSFSYKLNLGNYESCDLFCSFKKECYEKDIKEVSQQLHEFCKEEIIDRVSQIKSAIKNKGIIDESTGKDNTNEPIPF